MNILNQAQRFFRKLRRPRSSEPEVGSSQQEQLQSSQSNFGVLSHHESTLEYLQYRNRAYDPKPTFPCPKEHTIRFEYLGRYNPKPTFPYPEEHTICFEYLGRYSPEPNWKRWLSPFHHKTPQNAFCRGISVHIESMVPPVFFGKLSRPVKRWLRRGYKVEVLTPNHKFYTKVSLNYTKRDPEAEGSYSMTFEDDYGYWKSCGFDWGKTSYLEIWILLQRRPDQPISSTSITFLIQEATYNPILLLRGHDEQNEDQPDQNVWPRFSEAVDKYNKKYQRRYGIPLPEDIINDFRANFRYNILVPFRENIYHQRNLDDWGFRGIFRGVKTNDDRQRRFPHDIFSPRFEDGWYIKILQESEMIGSDLAIMPWAMSIWMTLQVASFAISGNSRSNDPIPIDPAVETTTYSVFLESIRDLPFKLNQWCQVDRSESKPIPFIRSSQFPCQKAYSVFATKMEADAEILQSLELYKHFFEEVLAVPIIKCKTSELEKFAVEAFLGLDGLGDAWRIRGATAHCLGQNVLENFNKNGEKATGWLNSWSCSIRVVGLMVMVHGNKNGLVLPPKVAPKQVIVTSRLNINDVKIRDACNCVVDMLCKAGIRAGADLDDFPLTRRCWEDKGVPLLLKVGPEVCVSKQVEAHRRDNKEINYLSMTSMVEKVKEILDEIQESLFEAAKRRQDACIQIVKNWDEFVEAVLNRRVILAPWCDEEMVEKDVKAEIGFITYGHGVKILCSPLDEEQPEITEDTKCFASGKPAKKWTYWGRDLLDEFKE